MVLPLSNNFLVMSMEYEFSSLNVFWLLDEIIFIGKHDNSRISITNCCYFINIINFHMALKLGFRRKGMCQENRPISLNEPMLCHYTVERIYHWR